MVVTRHSALRSGSASGRAPVNHQLHLTDAASSQSIFKFPAPARPLAAAESATAASTTEVASGHDLTPQSITGTDPANATGLPPHEISAGDGAQPSGFRTATPVGHCSEPPGGTAHTGPMPAGAPLSGGAGAPAVATSPAEGACQHQVGPPGAAPADWDPAHGLRSPTGEAAASMPADAQEAASPAEGKYHKTAHHFPSQIKYLRARIS